MRRTNGGLFWTMWLSGAAITVGGCGKDDGSGEGDSADTATETGDASSDESAETGDAADATPEIGPDGTDDAVVDAPGDAALDTPEDTGPDFTEWPLVERSEPGEMSDPDGFDPSEPPPEGEAHAGALREGTPIPFAGPEVRCRPGDFVLENEHIRVCIANERSVNQVLMSGGNIVDIARPGSDAGEVWDFGVPNTELLAASGDEVSLIADGGGDEIAVVRSSGVDLIPQLIAGVAGQILPSRNLHFETEYRLAPSARALEVVTWVDLGDNPNPSGIAVGDMLLPGDVTRSWFGGAEPWVQPARGQLMPIVVALADGVSYGVWSEMIRSAPLGLDGVIDFPVIPTTMTNGLLGPDREAVYVRYYAVGTGDTQSIREAFADLSPLPEGETVSFIASGIEGWAIPSFDIRRDGVSLDVIALDAAGEATAVLPAGSYVAIAIDPPSGGVVETAFEVPAGGEVVLDPGTVGWFDSDVDCAEGMEAPVACPARIRAYGPANREFFLVTGTERWALPPGEYSVHVSRGEEWSVATVPITIAAGEVALVEASLTRTLDTTGWSSGDFHQHSTRSVDSLVPDVVRVSSNLAAGVDFIAPSDHDAVSDFSTTVEEMGVRHLIFNYQGEEISPAYGHFNAFPLPYRHDLQSGGAVPLAERVGLREVDPVDTEDFIALVRERGARVVQVNHPRASSSGAGSYFTTAGYDPVLGPEARSHPSRWFGPFESVEVFNERDRFCQVARDWFGFLSRGIPLTGVGNSDTHSVSSPAGYPRNYLWTDTDSPADLNDDVITQAILDEAVSVSGGIFIDFPDGERPGDIVELASAGDYVLHTRLQSPPWAAVDELMVLVNGIVVERISLLSDAATLVDFDDNLTIAVNDDSYVVVIAWSAERMTEDTVGELPFGFTNALYVDVGGDGWSAPGVSGPDDLPPITGIPWCE